MIIAKDDAIRYLCRAKELQRDLPWLDIHVSPFEVIFNRFRYSPNPDHGGVFSLENSSYREPVIGPFRADGDPNGASRSPLENKTDHLSILLYRQAFAHIGPRVLSDQMMFSGIKKSLLLPVLHPESDGIAEMEIVSKLYGGDDHFFLGYCVPNVIPISDIAKDVKCAHRNYGIRAIKLNANITGIDLSIFSGKKRVEAILDACQAESLPIVVHGGKSPVLMNSISRNYSSLQNLSEIDWGITKQPVVISHGGMMGSSSIEIEHELMPELKKIISLHSHVMVDISALGINALCLLLKNIEADRIVFGSDYYYFSQWGTVVKLVHALLTTKGRFEDRFLKIVAINPSRIILEEI